MSRTVLHRLALLLGAALSGCTSSGGPTGPIAVRLILAIEPAASAGSGAQLAPQPVVQIVDAEGGSVASRGVLITVTIASGGGGLSGETAVRTEPDGRATFSNLALTGPVGVRTLRFSAVGLAAAISRQISVEAGPPAGALAQAGNNQTAAAGTVVPVAPAVRVTDGSGNPVMGARVTFAIATGGGAIAGSTPFSDAQGVATLGQWVLGTGIGQNSLTAAVDGLAGTPVVFTATGVVGPAASLTIVEGDGQQATIGTQVTTAPAVRVADAFGNPVAGLAITFAVTAGGGSVTGSVPISDPGGVARVGTWRLGFVPGVNTLSATRQGVPPASFGAEATDLAVSQISAGIGHSCAVGTDNVTRCWGDNTSGQLGNGTTALDSIPVATGTAQTFTQLVTGVAHSCGLTAAGAAWCWGVNGAGQLGDGTTTDSPVPVAVTGGLAFTSLTAFGSHTCGLRADGAAFCWGFGANGRLGDGFTLSRVFPVQVLGGHVFTTLSAGAAHTCGRRTDGAVLCWGGNANGRLGDGTTTERVTPTPVAGATLFTAVAAGGAHTCALDTGGAAWCWGLNSSGQIGDGTTTQRTSPATVGGGRTYIVIATGTQHSCAVTSLFEAFCWGENASGRLGDGTTTDRNQPVAVTGGLSYAALRTGDQHTCARTTSGSAICWGGNATGQLGDGSTAMRTSPVGVKRP